MALAGEEMFDGVSCQVYAWKPKQPVKVEEPHVIYEYRAWIDPTRQVQIRADGLNEDGAVVRTLRCTDLAQRDDGSWVPLTVTRDVVAGSTQGQQPWQDTVETEEGKRKVDAPLAFELPVDGYRQVTRYELFPDDRVLPVSVTRYNEVGALIMQLEFEYDEVGDLP
jgi:negative regulator of sigma E activity